MTHLADQIYAASKVSKAGADLWELFNILADDVDGDELLGRFDSYVDNLDSEAQALYRELKGVKS